MELGQLTERERNVYSFVVEWIRSNLSFPNAKEIAGGVGLPPDTARRILRSLGDKSFIDVPYASPATASRLKLIKRGEFRKVGERRLVLEVDLNSGYWFARHQLARAATQYAGCWKSHKAAVNGLTKMGFRPIFPRDQYGFRTDKNGNHILTTKQIVLLLALYQQQNARVASKDLWYEKCQDVLSRLGWQTTNRHLRGAAERLPGGGFPIPRQDPELPAV